MILSLDIATNTGWVVWKDGKPIKHGLLKLKSPRKGHHPHQKLGEFQLWIQGVEEVCNEWCYEEPFGNFPSRVVTGMMVGLEGILKAESYRRKVPLTGIPQGSVKGSMNRYCTSVGTTFKIEVAKLELKGIKNAKKQASVILAEQKWDIEIGNDNIADAYWVGDAYLRKTKEKK